MSELSKRKLAFFLKAGDRFFFLFFKRSLKGTLLQAMNPTRRWLAQLEGNIRKTNESHFPKT
ncbi:MAG: hypothetical protein WBV45_01000 [Lutimonas sp.]